MKRIICFGILAALTFSACQQENLEPVEDLGFSATIEEFEGHTRTSLTTGNSVVWSKDDMVAIFKGYSTPSQFKVSSSSAGNTAASFDEVSSNTKGSSIPANVAVYPYNSNMECSFIQESSNGNAYEISDVVFPDEQIYSKGSFGNGSFVMAAVTKGTKDKKLKFRNVSGAIRLRVKGKQTITAVVISGNAGEIVAGKASVTAYADGSAPKVGELEDGSDAVTLDCGDGVQLSQSVATEFIIALPPTTFSQGFTVTLFSADGKTSEHVADKSNTVGRSKILNMPEILFGRPSGDLTPDGCEDIAEQGTANSYIVSEPGDYSFPTVRGNSTQSVGSVASVEVLWETFGTSDVPEVGDLITDIMYENGRIFFRTAYDLREGNAVIAAKNHSGTILWSWHIWLTDQPQEHIYANGAGTLMDRNLGATSATPGDVGALGLLYQWGRKDPFLGSAEILLEGSVIDEYSRAKATVQRPEYVVSDPSVGTIEYTIEHPMQFIVSNDYEVNDWFYNPYVTEPSKRWDSEKKTIYDPCPPGWSVPYGGFDGFWVTAGVPETLDFDSNKGGCKFPSSISGSEAWYPCTGYDNGNLTNVIVFTRENNQYNKNVPCGFYWTSTTYQSDYMHFEMLAIGDNMGFGDILANPHLSNGSQGLTVRCYKEGSSSLYAGMNDYIDEYGINCGKGINIDGVIWAPVNCGYHATDYPYGKLYQWGRKYGQGYSTEYDASVPTIKSGPVSLNTAQSESNANNFYKSQSDWLSSPDSRLWNRDEYNPAKTDNDPCPKGWRVPTRTEMSDLIQNSSGWVTFSDGRAGYAFSGSKSFSTDHPYVLLYAAGFRGNGNGSANNRDKSGDYWTSTASGGKAYDIYFHSNGVNINEYNRAYGYSVRCVQE